MQLFISTKTSYIPYLKKSPQIFGCNLNKNCQISIIFAAVCLIEFGVPTNLLNVTALPVEIFRNSKMHWSV